MLESNSTTTRSSKTNLILAAVLIVLGAFAYWYEFTKKPQLAKQEENKDKLIFIDETEELQSFSISNKAKNLTLTMTCKENCKLNSPNAIWDLGPHHADASNINSFLTSLSNLKSVEVLSPEGDVESFYKRYSLDANVRGLKQATLKTAKQNTTIYFGSSSAIGENLYLLLETQGKIKPEVILVSGYIRNSMDKNESYWREKKLIHMPASDLQKLTITNPSGKLVFDKKDRAWTYNNGTPTDTDTVDSLINSLSFLSAQEFVSDDKNKDRAKFKLTKPQYTAQLQDGKSTVDVDFYEIKTAAPVVATKSKGPHHHAKSAGPSKLYAVFKDKNFIAEVEPSLAAKFAKNAKDYAVKPKQEKGSSEESMEQTAKGLLDKALKEKTQKATTKPNTAAPTKKSGAH